MKESPFVQSIIRYLGNFFYTQLALTISSTVILVGWGLDLSLMSLVGNLIFGPFLMIFLMLSSLLLFGSLLGIPCGYIARALCAFTHWWDWILKQSSSLWLIGFPKMPAVLLLCLMLALIGIAFLARSATQLKKVCGAGVIAVLVFSSFALVWKNKNVGSGTIALAENLYVIKLFNIPEVIIVDNGFFNKKQSIEKSIDYELKPWLTKHYGHVTIRELRLMRPCMRSFQAALYCTQCWQLKDVWLPFFETELNKKGWRYFFMLREALAKTGGRLVRQREKS